MTCDTCTANGDCYYQATDTTASCQLLRGNHYAVVVVDGHERVLHKQCAKERGK